MITGNVFKIKKEKIEVWKEWCESLNSQHRKEAENTLFEEGLIRESFFIFNSNSEYFTIGLVEHIGEIIPANMEKEINIKNKDKKRECLEYIGPIEVLYDLHS